MVIVVVHKLAQEMIEVPLAKHNEFLKALQFDRLNEPLASAIYTHCHLHRIVTVGAEFFGLYIRFIRGVVASFR